MIPVTTFADKTVAVFGLGSSGIATARALIAGGATVAAWDDGEAGRAAAEKAGIPLVDLDTADWTKFAALVLAPGVPLTHPEPHWTVHKAIAAKIEIIGDIELFCRERNAHCPDATFIAITGTNGKSTTTSLIAHILRSAGKDAQMGGNIGVPILALEPPAKDRIYVIEMSSFQIDLTPSLNPTVGVLLNITPDHIDRHGTVENYAAIKERLVSSSRVAFVGADDAWCREIAQRRASKHSPTIVFAVDSPIDAGWSVDSNQIVAVSRNEQKPFGDLTGVPTLRGRHNAQNALAAIAAIWEIRGIPGLLDRDRVDAAIKTYPGLAHRMEEIGRIGNVLFINDSKATNADSTEKALLSFPKSVHWILGGKPKDGGIEPLRPYFPGIAKAYLIGAASDEFAKTLEGHVPYERCGTLDVAVAKAARDAAIPSPRPLRGEGEGEGRVLAQSSIAAAPHPNPLPIEGDGERERIVLLSPACASYDQFKSFEHRGDAFRALVNALPGFTPRAKA
jgi:UDP-N-acetylmuramoylalanine--D-glutamate ligase